MEIVYTWLIILNIGVIGAVMVLTSSIKAIVALKNQ